MEIHSYEIVVARYTEDISWLFNVNKKWKITIYNKGPKFDNLGTIKIRNPNITIINIENKGREAETIAYHMLHRYDNYSDLTVFIQADPFDHAPEMKELLEVLVNKTTMDPETEKYIPMTTQYDEKIMRIPPPEVVAKRVNRFFHIEETSVYTLNCIYYDEPTIIGITKQFRDYYKLPINANVVRTFFNKMGCADTCLKSRQTTIKFNFSACFALPKYSLMKYTKEFYEKMYKLSYEQSFMPWILERTWLTLFDPEFDPSKILPEYSLPGPE
jgi:hypothetical protein